MEKSLTEKIILAASANNLGELIRLTGLQMQDLDYDESTNEIVVPSWRQDLLCDADMAEEVARFYGYSNIPTTLPQSQAQIGGISFRERVEKEAGTIARANGFSQAMTYSFESPKVFDKLLFDKDAPERAAIKIANPLGEDFSIMRTIPLNGILTSLSSNYNHRNSSAALYELAKVYIPKQLPLTELPDERVQFTLGEYGYGDFFTMKGVVEDILEHLGMGGNAQYDPQAGKPFLHPGRQAKILYEGEQAGYMGEVHPVAAGNYGLEGRVVIAVLDMPVLEKFVSFDRKYEEFPRFPSVSRDISLVVPKKVLNGQILEAIRVNGGQYMESVELFDLYEGSQIQPGYKSMAYTIRFRAKDRTLSDADVAPVMEKGLGSLGDMGIKLRA